MKLRVLGLKSPFRTERDQVSVTYRRYDISAVALKVIVFLQPDTEVTRCEVGDAPWNGEALRPENVAQPRKVPDGKARLQSEISVGAALRYMFTTYRMDLTTARQVMNNLRNQRVPTARARAR